MSDCYNIALPKWPAMVVVGEPVTKDQAAEILVRTFPWFTMSNDREWTRQCLAVAGIKESEYGGADWESLKKESERLGLLGLSYLDNARIHSAWIGGPHGWCDWSGRIFCNTHNIGKWPSVEEVHEDWKAIAAAFPFLKLRCQLYSGETSEGGFPLVEFVVCEGVATVKEPGEGMPRPAEPAWTVDMYGDTRGERGCTLDMLKHAVAVAEKSVASR